MIRLFILLLIVILVIEIFNLIYAIRSNILLDNKIKQELIQLKKANSHYKDTIKNRILLNDKLEILKSKLSNPNITCEEQNYLIDNFIVDVLKG